MICGGEKHFDVEIDIDMELLQTLVFLEFWRIFEKAAILTLSSPDYFWVSGLGGWGRGGGGGLKVRADHNTEIIHGIDVKLGRDVENHKLLNLMYFN